MHREERDFSIVLHLSAEFPDDYTGDDDGFGWHDVFEQSTKPRLLSALLEVLRADPDFQVRAAPRGADPERVLELELTRRPKAP